MSYFEIFFRECSLRGGHRAVIYFILTKQMFLHSIVMGIDSITNVLSPKLGLTISMMIVWV